MAKCCTTFFVDVIPIPYKGPIFVGSSSTAQRTAMYASQPQSSPPWYHPWSEIGI